MLNKTKYYSVVIILSGIVLSGFLAGCSKKEAVKNIQLIRVAGSDNMVKLAEKWSKEFEKIYPGTKVAVSGSGDDVGILMLINKRCDIAMTARSINKEEFNLAAENKIVLLEYIVGIDSNKKDKTGTRKLLLLYTNSKPAGTLKDFIDFTTGAKGQEIVKKAGFIPIRHN